MNAGNGNDVIVGGDGDDTINAGGGNDTLIGGLGNDRLNGNGGNDIASTGEGNDDPEAGATLPANQIETIDESFVLTAGLLLRLDGV